MCLAFIAENKSMRHHSLGKRGDRTWEIFQDPHDPFDSICLSSNEMTTSSLYLSLPFLLSRLLSAFPRFSLLAAKLLQTLEQTLLQMH